MKTAQLIAEHQAQNTDLTSVEKPKRKMHPNSIANLVAPWEPGCPSPNPSGRPRDTAADISRKAFEKNQELIYNSVVKQIVESAYGFSVHADRVWGKAKQSIIHMGDEDGGPVRTNITVEFIRPDGNR